MGHRNAPLTPEGRRRLCQRVDAGRPICHVASEAGVARQTLAKWHARWVQDGDDGLHDRSSRPCRSPKQTDPQVEDLVEWLRRGMKLGPVMLVAELAEFNGLPEIMGQHCAQLHVLVKPGAIEDDASPALALGVVQRQVGPAQEVGRAVAVSRNHGNPDTRPNEDLPAKNIDGPEQ